MNKQIEEMAKVIEEAMAKARRTLGGHNNIAMFYATMLVNAGYCKIPENAVVLTREEYNRLLGQYKNLEINYNCVWEDFRRYEIENEILKQNIVVLRKETAEKFAERLKEHLKQSFTDLRCGEIRKSHIPINLYTLYENIDEICKEITEDITEGNNDDKRTIFIQRETCT